MPTDPLASLHPLWLGRLDYDAAHALQVDVRDRVQAGEARPTLLLVEHDPVVTLGRRGPLQDLLADESVLAAQGIALRETERGGRATYHGPGQLVAYPIARIRTLARDVPTYVWGLEETVIRTVARLGIAARRHPEQRGVWMGEAKLASLGIAVTRGICWHGLSLNVAPDLAAFRLIRACGLEVEATSIAHLVGNAPSLPDVAHLVAEEFAHVFDLALEGDLRSQRRSPSP